MARAFQAQASDSVKVTSRLVTEEEMDALMRGEISLDDLDADDVEDEDDDDCDCAICRIRRGELRSQEMIGADQVGSMFIFMLRKMEESGYVITERLECPECGLKTMMTHCSEESLACPRCKHRVRSHCPAPVGPDEPSVWDYRQVLEELSLKQPALAAELNDRARSLASGG